MSDTWVLAVRSVWFSKLMGGIAKLASGSWWWLAESFCLWQANQENKSKEKFLVFFFFWNFLFFIFFVEILISKFCLWQKFQILNYKCEKIKFRDLAVGTFKITPQLLDDIILELDFLLSLLYVLLQANDLPFKIPYLVMLIGHFKGQGLNIG